MSGQRRYTDQEFALILRKALELEARAPTSSSHGGGMTLEEIQAVARDVGMDPEQVARAARLLPSLEGTAGQRLAGGPSKVSASYRSARSLGPEGMSRVVSVVRDTLATQGAVDHELDGVTWKSQGDTTQIFMTLRPDGDGTEVQLRMDRSAAAILTWFGTIAASAFLAGALGNTLAPEGVLGGILYFLAFVMTGVGIGRTLWWRNSRLAQARFQELLETVARAVDSAPGLPSPGGPSEPSPDEADDPGA